MKKLLLLFVVLGSFLTLQAQVSKTVALSTAGTLSSTLTTTELNTVTNLTVTGNIDARDFRTMRDLMPMLADIDLSDVTIEAYNGIGGTKLNGNNYPTAAIPENAFITPDTRQSKTSLISVVLPSLVSSIGNSAFEFCTGLTSVTLPSSLISIGNFAFNGCSGLTTITIPSSITSIGKAAFQSCSGLTTVAIPSSVTYIDEYIFNKCSGLTSVTIPSSVISIGTSAFENCSSLASVTIPSSVKYIGAYAFFYCSGLITIAIPSSVTSIGEAAFARCYGLTAVTIPQSVTLIRDAAFQSCIRLTTITIPPSVTSIGNEAFYNCTGLTSLYANNPTPVDLSSKTNVFSGIDKTTCMLYVPSSSINLYKSANQWKDFTNIVEMEGTGSSKTVNLTTAGTLSTILSPTELASITSLTITGNMDARDFKTIRDNMPLLADIDLSKVKIASYSGRDGTYGGENMQYPENGIPRYAFGYPANTVEASELVKKNIKTITPPELTSSLGKGAFYGCSNLISFSIPPSVTSIDNGAFNNCTGLTSLYVSNPTPVDLSLKTSVFSGIDKTICMLYVPSGSANLYKSANQWKDFVNIQSANQPPVANAGLPQTVNEKTTVILNGSGSTDADGDLLSYSWTAPSGIVLSNPTTSNPTFVAPDISTVTAYTFTLTVSDGTATATASTRVTVNPDVPYLMLTARLNGILIPESNLHIQLFKKNASVYNEKPCNYVIESGVPKIPMEPGTWIVLVSPKTPNSFVPTYSGNSIVWESAQTISILAEGIVSTTIDCTPVSANVEQGNGEISGFVYSVEGLKRTSLVKGPLVGGTPVSGVLVQLFKKGGKLPVANCYTDEKGFYQFDKIKISEYEIIIQLPGYTQSERLPAALTESVQSAVVYIAVNTTTQFITNTDNLTDGTALKIYPNPVIGPLTIDFGSDIVVPGIVSVYNIQGGLLMQHELLGTIQTIDMSELMRGSYLVTVKSGGKMQSKIIIKK